MGSPNEPADSPLIAALGLMPGLRKGVAATAVIRGISHVIG